MNEAGEVIDAPDALPPIDSESMGARRPIPWPAHPPPTFSAFAIPPAQFDTSRVGAKSRNLELIRGRLPEWIHLPSSVALPFGVFERVLRDESNPHLSARYDHQVAQALHANPSELPQHLAELRATINALVEPEELRSSLLGLMAQQGIPAPGPWEDLWIGIKQVWASKWNERAFLSRRANGIPHDELTMAVLIQTVVPAEYSFVVHTVNPVSGNRDELYAEVVLGLGEALVGNSPGRAFGFTWSRAERQITLQSFSSKSTGLFGRGLYIRSDSNGEDLTGYSGAGLYDSVLLPPGRWASLVNPEEPLFWDGRFREELLHGIAHLGEALETLLGAPQDIEGAWAQGTYYLVQTRPQVGLRHA